MAESNSRSKSAPPTEQDRDNIQQGLMLLETGVRGYSYEVKRNEEGRLHVPLSTPSFDSETLSHPDENPDDQDHPEVQKNNFSAPQQLATHPNNNSNAATVAKVQSEIFNEQEPAQSVGSLRQQQQQPSPQSSSAKSSEGVLVLRPNPTKPNLPPLASKQGMAGVIAPAPLISPTPFVAANSAPRPARPIALSPQQQQQQQNGPSSVATASVEIQESRNIEEQQETWCQQATEEARIEKQATEEARIEKEQQQQQQVRKEQEKQAAAREKKRQAEIRRLQDLQCEFPVVDNTNNMDSGRASVDAEAYGDERDMQQQQSSSQAVDKNDVNRPQHEPAARTSASTTRNRRSGEEQGRNNNTIQSTSVFQRLVTDEVREIQVYTRMVESLNVELDKMRLFQKDLERRLQDESKRNEQLEETLEAREREWFLRFEELEREIKRLGGVVRAEENKNKSLVDQIRKKDQDIQGMLKKKYDHESAGGRPSVRNIRAESQRAFPANSAYSKSPEANAHQSPDHHLRLLGSAEKVRERNTRHLLMDFFGL